MAESTREDRYVFSPGWRTAAVLYLVVTVPFAVWLGSEADGRRGYLTAWAVAAAIYAVPALLAAPIAQRGIAARDRSSWRLWWLGWWVVYGGAGVVYLAGARGLEGLHPLVALAAVVGVGMFAVGNTAALHRRSGQRDLLLDVVDLLLAALAIVGPVVLLVAEPILTSAHGWFTIPAALAAIGLVHGIVALVLMTTRVPRGRRAIVWVVVAFLLVALADAAAQMGQGITDFGLPSGPLVGLHALCQGGGVLLAGFAVHRSSPGLDRLPPHRQVRKNGVLAAMVTASVVLIAVETWWRRDQPWVVATAVGLLIALVLLSTVRLLRLGRETVRLYGEVERAAAERLELLNDVMHSVDSDRHRAATQLHKQAAALYTAMASFAAADVTAQRVRFDLGRQVDSSHQMLSAIRPLVPEHEGLGRLMVLTRAYVGNLYGDIRRPELDVSIDARLALDWTHEVVVFRIVQLAVHNIWQHAEATRIGVSMTAPDGALRVEVRDDGIGFEPDRIVPGSGIVTMRSLVGFVDGWIEIDSAPGGGTRVRAVVGQAQPMPPGPTSGPPRAANGRPRLRVIRSAEPPRSRT